MICWDVNRLYGCKITRRTHWLEVLTVYHFFVMYCTYGVSGSSLLRVYWLYDNILFGAPGSTSSQTFYIMYIHVANFFSRRSIVSDFDFHFLFSYLFRNETILARGYIERSMFVTLYNVTTSCHCTIFAIGHSCYAERAILTTFIAQQRTPW